MNDKQLRFLIHCIAMSYDVSINKRKEIEGYINQTFDELGDDE